MSPTQASPESLISELLAYADNPNQGLPKPLFYFVSQLTPLINVDLLIQNEQSHTLLTWREDEFFGPGWHVPGGIIRFKETIKQRIAEVARLELGCTVTSSPAPTSINQVMAPRRDVRGHFISLLFECQLTTAPPDPRLKFADNMPMHGHWAWHATCPQNIIPVHEMYRDYINAKSPRHNSNVTEQ